MTAAHRVLLTGVRRGHAVRLEVWVYTQIVPNCFKTRILPAGGHVLWNCIRRVSTRQSTVFFELIEGIDLCLFFGCGHAHDLVLYNL